MVVGAHALHLNVLNLRCTTMILLVQAGAFASEELLLLGIATARNDTVFKLVRFGCWALGLRELLGHNTIGLVDRVLSWSSMLNLDVLVGQGALGNRGLAWARMMLQLDQAG